MCGSRKAGTTWCATRQATPRGKQHSVWRRNPTGFKRVKVWRCTGSGTREAGGRQASRVLSCGGSTLCITAQVRDLCLCLCPLPSACVFSIMKRQGALCNAGGVAPCSARVGAPPPHAGHSVAGHSAGHSVGASAAACSWPGPQAFVFVIDLPACTQSSTCIGIWQEHHSQEVCLHEDVVSSRQGLGRRRGVS